MTTKNCANVPKLELKDLCEKSFVRNDRLPLKNVTLALDIELEWYLHVSPLVTFVSLSPEVQAPVV